MKIQVYLRTNYGARHIYVHGEDTARDIEVLTRKRTLTEGQLTALQLLGHEIEVIPDPERTINLN